MTSGSISANGTFHGSMTFMPPRFPMPAVAGQPYSAEQVNENVQTLADGTHITQHHGGGHIFRDSAGRTRIEHTIFMGPNVQQDGPVFVQITDPVAGYEYALDAQKRIAYRFTLPAQTDRPVTAPARREVRGGMGMATGGAAGVPAAPPPPAMLAQQQTSSEPLGTQLIEGVLAEGRRTIHTVPVGAQGNDRPLVSTTEFWFSPDLRLTVLTKHSDPRMGENTTKLINISRAEPDPTLFQPPPEYQVVDATDRVTIEYTR